MGRIYSYLMSFIDQNQILELSEKLIAKIWKEVKGITLNIPFKRITWEDSMNRYGTDRPDTRYGMELIEVNSLFKNIGFKVFSNAIASGGSLKCITIPDGNKSISNVRIKPGGDIFSEAQKGGAGGLAFIRVREKEKIDTIGAIKENMSEEAINELLTKTNDAYNQEHCMRFIIGPKLRWIGTKCRKEHEFHSCA